MIRYFLVLMLFFIVSASDVYSQIQIVRIKSQHEIDSIRNNTHYKIVKLSDSAWYASRYDANDTLMNTGTFRDENLQIPEGKFKFYEFIESVKEIRYDYTTHLSDTVIVPAKNFLKTVGYFTNGKRTSIWHTYESSPGKLSLTEMYKDNKLNGLYQKYNSETGKVLVVGNYINDVREGNWDQLSFDGDIMETDVYKKGRIIKSISRLSEKKFQQKMTGGRPTYDFIRYLNHKLADKTFNTIIDQKILYSFIENTQGKLTKPNVITGSILAVDSAVIDAMLDAPTWQPPYMNNKLVNLSIPFSFHITISGDKHITITD